MCEVVTVCIFISLRPPPPLPQTKNSLPKSFYPKESARRFPTPKAPQIANTKPAQKRPSHLAVTVVPEYSPEI